MPVATQQFNEEALRKGGLPHLRFFDAIAELPYVKAMYLFGSRARGTFHQNSDIDLAVEYTDDDEWHRRVVKVIAAELSDTFLDVDIVDYNGLKTNTSFQKSVDDDKVPLYERI